MNFKLTLVTTLAAASLLSACQKEATGQVAAVVDGEEITLQEINAELQGARLPEGADKKAASQAILQRIIERRLLAKAAKEDGLDKEQEYLIRSRQVNDALLVQMLSERASRGVQVPNDGAIKTFIAQNTGTFGNRTIFTTDQVQFRMPSDPKVLQAFQPDHTMDAVISRLNQLGIKFTRRTAEMDSLQFPQQALDQIRAAPQGEPLVFPINGGVMIAAVTGSRLAPIAGDDAKAMAVQGLRNKEVGTLIDQRLKAERAKAKIQYQPGFAPPADAGKSGGAAAAK